MAYLRIAERVFREPWLIEPGAHAAITALLMSRMGETYAGDRRMPERDDWSGQAAEYYQVLPGGIARITSLRGIIGKRITAMELDCGACSLDHFMEAVDRALADPVVRSVVVDFDSPGGQVTGVAEAARHFRAAVEGSWKPVVGWCETKSCSAAQWIMAACPVVAASPSAAVGSIGVYMAWLDWSRAREAEGANLELFEAGRYKAAGLRPLRDDERARYQAQVEATHAEFKSAVWGWRADVPEEAMEGQVLSGAEAVGLGLVDLLCDTFEDMLAELGLVEG